MIIDVHYHLIPSIPEEMLALSAVHPIRAAHIMGIDIDRDTIMRRLAEVYPDPTGEKVLASMGEHGIDFTCVCTVDNIGRFSPEAAQERNRWIAGIANKYSDRLAAFAGVDPRRPNAEDMMRQCIEEFGVIGLKYHPDYGYDPAGAGSYRLLEIVQRNNGVLLTHTGPLGPPARPKYSEPMRLADLAVDFPDLKIIAAHMGQIDWRPWANLASHQRNLYGDLAMWDAFAFGRYELFCRELRDLIDYAGIEKVLFGTDNPIFGILHPTRVWIKLIAQLPVNAPDGINFTKAEVAAILGGNAASLLNSIVVKG
jgi:predicted TIM-barrel fold metal-dependent hydrolase